MLRSALVAIAIYTLASPAGAQSVHVQRVQFARSATSSAIQGDVRGDAIMDYAVTARAGQTLSVALRTNNSSNYFNVTAPQAQEAMFVGSSGGLNFSGVLPTSGDYVVRVYLMRNAARRNETAAYTLTISVNAQPAAASAARRRDASAAVSQGNMPAYCRGQASEVYGVRPNYIHTGPIVRSGETISIDGTADKGAEGIKRFRCRFDARGHFIDVMSLTSDGE
jgi:hypothetical protein